MVSSAAKTVKQYLEELPAERRAAIAAVRRTIRRHLPAGYQEIMNWGMIAYEIPLSRHADTYNGQPLMYAALAAQKNYCALYLMAVYSDAARLGRLRKAFKDAGLKLDMGKSCVRFQTAQDLPLECIGELIAEIPVDAYIARYVKSRQQRSRS